MEGAKKPSMGFVSSACPGGLRTNAAVCGVRWRMGGVERETVKSEEGKTTGVKRVQRLSAAEKAKGNGTPPRVRTGGPAKSLGFAWPGMLIGLAAQSMPLLAHSPRADALYFFLVASSALYAGGKRNPTEVPIDDLSPQQALLAPFISGFFLVTCYLLLRYTPIDIGMIFQYMTTVFGGICLKETLDPLFFSVFTKLQLQEVTKAIGEDGCEEDVESWYSPKNLMAGAVSAAITGAYAFKVGPTFAFSNIIGFGLGVRCISLLKPRTTKAAAALLVGLLLYDVFFVFGTDVMVSVATGIEAPAKFLFPRETTGNTGPDSYPFAILGLGDVVIPGIFASLMAFVDKELVFGDQREASHVPNGPYFTSAMFAYVGGLVTCFFFNAITRSAQPALLYLVPFLLTSAAVTGARRGELEEVVGFERTSQVSIVDRDRKKEEADKKAGEG